MNLVCVDTDGSTTAASIVEEYKHLQAGSAEGAVVLPCELALQGGERYEPHMASLPLAERKLLCGGGGGGVTRRPIFPTPPPPPWPP